MWEQLAYARDLSTSMAGRQRYSAPGWLGIEGGGESLIVKPAVVSRPSSLGIMAIIPHSWLKWGRDGLNLLGKRTKLGRTEGKAVFRHHRESEWVRKGGGWRAASAWCGRSRSLRRFKIESHRMPWSVVGWGSRYFLGRGVRSVYSRSGRR